jgi:hypothetical protein
MTIHAGEAVRINPRCLLTELGDGTGVVLDLDTKFYFTLNRTGVFVWKELTGGREGVTPEAIANKLEQRFDVGQDAAVQDVLHILETMAGEGLVQPFATVR